MAGVDPIRSLADDRFGESVIGFATAILANDGRMAQPHSFLDTNRFLVLS
jgi:hypothetical protein